MITRQLTVTLQQPTQLSTRARADTILATEGFVPGAVLRGALASAWITLNGAPESGSNRAGFIALFEGAVRFAPAYLGEPPISLAVRKHKYSPREDCDPLEIDMAVTSGRAPTSCRTCEGQLEDAKGLRGKDTAAAGRHTSVPIGEKGIAQDGQLFSRDSMRAGLVLQSTLTGPAAAIEELAGLGTIWLGGRRTSHGMATLRLGDVTTPPLPERTAGGVILRLASPAVFVDDYGRPSLTPNAADLSDQLGVQCRIVRSWTRWHDVGGWHAASGLPKPTELAASAGSTYVLEPCPGAGSITDEALERLGREGVGLRRHEGFGHLAGPPRLALSAEAIREREGKVARLVENLRHVAAHPEVLAALRGYATEPPTVDREAVVNLAERYDDSLKLVSAQVRRATDRALGMPLLRAALSRMGDMS